MSASSALGSNCPQDSAGQDASPQALLSTLLRGKKLSYSLDTGPGSPEAPGDSEDLPEDANLEKSNMCVYIEKNAKPHNTLLFTNT